MHLLFTVFIYTVIYLCNLLGAPADATTESALPGGTVCTELARNSASHCRGGKPRAITCLRTSAVYVL